MGVTLKKLYETIYSLKHTKTSLSERETLFQYSFKFSVYIYKHVLVTVLEK